MINEFTIQCCVVLDQLKGKGHPSSIKARYIKSIIPTIAYIVGFSNYNASHSYQGSQFLIILFQHREISLD